MDLVKIIGIGFVTLIIALVLKEYKKEYAIFASLIGGMLIIFFSIETLSYIVEFINDLTQKSNYNNFIELLLKITGISILTEYAVSICKDSGESAIANKIDFGSKILVISLSIPVISTTIESLTSLLP